MTMENENKPMDISEIISKRPERHLPGYHTDMEYSPFELYEIYRGFGIKDSELENDFREWSKNLEQKFNEAENYNKKESALYELIKLYEVSRSSIVKRPLEKIYDRDDDEFIRRRVGSALGYNKFIIEIHDFFVKILKLFGN